MNRIYLPVIRFALACLLVSMIVGLLAAFSFLTADTFGRALPFHYLRPIHVSLAVFWILTAASGGLLFYIQEKTGKLLAAKKSVAGFLLFWVCTVILIQCSFLAGRFGGREYWEFPPLLSVPLLGAWVMFAWVFFRTLSGQFRNKPVYLWMWMTGVIFFFITYLENNLWQLPWFRNNIIRDITVQWKSNGALVGSWNMIIYGTGIYLMCRISGDESAARRPISYFFYFLGLTNLLFNWGHHTYLVPAAPWVRYVSYAVSMTEWVIFLNIIRTWRSTLNEARKYFYHVPYRFLMAAEFWVMTNLILAIFMSIPAINAYTHGTHVTVAHVMGSMIGINSMMLLASVTYIWEQSFGISFQNAAKRLNTGYWITNISLLVFMLALLSAGVIRGYYTIALGETNHNVILEKTWAPLALFTVSGVTLLCGLGSIVLVLLRVRIKNESVQEIHAKQPSLQRPLITPLQTK